jgi:hypothetical protein
MAIIPTLVSGLTFIFQVYLMKMFVQTTMQPALQSNFFRSIVLAIVVVVVMNSLAVVGVALTMNLMAFAFFKMEPGNVVPVINSQKYEIHDSHVIQDKTDVPAL